MFIHTQNYLTDTDVCNSPKTSRLTDVTVEELMRKNKLWRKMTSSLENREDECVV